MRLRFRAARSVRSTRYAMLGTDFVEHHAGEAGATSPQIFQPLPDAFGGTGLRREVEKVLVSFRVLHDRRRLAVDRQNYRALGILQVPHDFRRVIAEGGHWLDVFGDVHGKASCVNIVPNKVISLQADLASQLFEWRWACAGSVTASTAATTSSPRASPAQSPESSFVGTPPPPPLRALMADMGDNSRRRPFPDCLRRDNRNLSDHLEVARVERVDALHVVRLH